MQNPKEVNPQEDATELAAKVASRICHDLIGPIGAIVNGLELLEMVGGMPGPEQALIARSAESASAKLRFFRIAFGAAGEQTIGGSELTTLLEEISRDGRMEITWHPQGAQPRRAVKLAFLALLCCEVALPRGGEAEVTEADGAWAVTASGTTVAVDPENWAWLEGAGDPAVLLPAKVQFALLPLAAAQMGRQLSGEYDDEGLTLRF